MNESTLRDITETLERIANRQDRIYIKVGYLEKLMTVIANGGKVHQAGGYAYGRTKAGDAFILLYAPHNSMVHKLCRVYPEDFDKLPHFIPVSNPPGGASELNLTKTELKKRGLYHNCPSFKFATVEGKDTQMGPEIRFYDTMFVEREAEARVQAADPLNTRPPIASIVTPEREKAAPEQLSETTDGKGQTLEEFNQGIIQAEVAILFSNGDPVPANATPYYDQHVSIVGSTPWDLKGLREWYATYLKTPDEQGDK